MTFWSDCMHYLVVEYLANKEVQLIVVVKAEYISLQLRICRTLQFVKKVFKLTCPDIKDILELPWHNIYRENRKKRESSHFLYVIA